MRLSALVRAASILLAAAASAAGQQPAPVPPQLGMQGMPMGTTMAAESSGALVTAPLGGDSPLGVVTLDGRTLRLAWSGDQPGSRRPWAIHRGTCGRDEGVVGIPGGYPPISVDAEGRGSARAPLPHAAVADAHYFIAVSAGVPGASPAELACGPLELASANGEEQPAAGMSMPMPGQPSAGGMAGMNMERPMAGMNGSGGNQPVRQLLTKLRADPVIRARIAADPALRRAFEAVRAGAERGAAMSMPMTGAKTAPRHARARKPMSGMPMGGMPRPSGRARERAPAAGRPAGQHAAATRAPAHRTATRGKSKMPAMPGMKGMSGT